MEIKFDNITIIIKSQFFLLNIVSGSKLNVKIIDFTGNEWVKLKDLANSIYNYFNCLEYIKYWFIKKTTKRTNQN
jgi:hypothetical protein